MATANVVNGLTASTFAKKKQQGGDGFLMHRGARGRDQFRHFGNCRFSMWHLAERRSGGLWHFSHRPRQG